MFDFIIRAGQAYEQVGYFIGAIICLGLGALILGNMAYWRIHALRAAGTILGVIVKNGMYTTVYRYTLPDGQSQEAKADISSSSAAGRETGRAVSLLVSPHDPAKARESGFDLSTAIIAVAGAMLAGAGIWLGYVAVAFYKVTWMTWVMAAGMLIYAGYHVRNIAVPRGQRPSLAAWRAQRGLDAPVDLNDVQPIERIVANANTTQMTARSWQSPLAAPIVAMFAFALLAIGIYQSLEVARLQANGLRTSGEVIRLSRESDSSGKGHDSYYPIVRFRTEKNVPVEFKHNVGSNPPGYRRGDKVTVLYLTDNPVKKAIIDNGAVWNWAIPAALLFGTALLFWMLSAILRTRRQNSAGTPPAPDVIVRRAGAASA